MRILADTSFLYAIFNVDDSNHIEAASFALALSPDSVLVPDVVLPELAYLALRDAGYAGLQSVLESLRRSSIELVPLERSDLERISEIAATNSSAEFDIVDCCIMAIAERLGITKIATFDRRDFSIFRPRHCTFFELLPSE